MSITRINSLGITDGTIVNGDINASAGITLAKLTGVNDAKAWVNFNGTGTPAIRGSFNVSSITDNGTGNYTVNFTNALTDSNYSASYSVSNVSGSVIVKGTLGGTYSTSAVQILCFVAGGADTDVAIVGVSIFR